MCQTLEPYLEPIWTQLINHCQCGEEGTRKVVAECLGKLISMYPNELLPRLQSCLEHEDSLARSTVVQAIKFVISEQPQPIDPLLKKCLINVLKRPENDNEDLVTFNSVELLAIAHDKSGRSEVLLREGNRSAALDQMLGAVAASPDLRNRDEFIQRCYALIKDVDIAVEDWDQMLGLAIRVSVSVLV